MDDGETYAFWLSGLVEEAEMSQSVSQTANGSKDWTRQGETSLVNESDCEWVERLDETRCNRLDQ